MQSTTTPPSPRPAVRSTYRSLRLGLVAMVAMLATAVGVEAARSGCWLDSLSAYYWTGAHDVVVGALSALGVLLVVYAGADDVEDALLDAAGFLALVVALSPTQPGAGCPATRVADVPAALADARTGLTALVVVGLVVTLTRAAVAVRGAPTAGDLARGAAALVVLVPAAALVLAPDLLVARAHDAAAVLLFVAVIGVVVRHAFLARATSARWAIAYSALGALMLLTLSVVVALHATVPTWTHAVLVVEAALVALFATFWVLQTVELWEVDTVRGRPSGRPR
ncbi:hypothetical protein [Cellulomonas phragmiteti]|uniref:Uncharacterized protein n=1 Tax=Cellulomonas phragmiteti TaxID=478780 RepID=A0ABQ4DJE3_9CELL|nr:hypothetical protein [Cellulomonas phragmiteti]GIG39455.1 hypothetical protein Cph01nite_12170 [Cellulomonas phragmiteti]